MHKHANSEKTTRSGAEKSDTDLHLVPVSKHYRASQLKNGQNGKNHRFPAKTVIFAGKNVFF